MPSYLGVPAALLQRLQDEEVLGVENRIEVPVESLWLILTPFSPRPKAFLSFDFLATSFTPWTLNFADLLE